MAAHNECCASYSRHYTKHMGRKVNKSNVKQQNDWNDNNIDLDLLAHDPTGKSVKGIMSYCLPYLSSKRNKHLSFSDFDIHLIRKDNDAVEIHFTQPISLKSRPAVPTTLKSISGKHVTSDRRVEKAMDVDSKDPSNQSVNYTAKDKNKETVNHTDKEKNKKMVNLTAKDKNSEAENCTPKDITRDTIHYISKSISNLAGNYNVKAIPKTEISHTDLHPWLQKKADKLK